MFASRIVLSVALLLAVPCLAMAQDEVVSSAARAKTLPSDADIAKAKADADAAAAAAKPAVSQDMMIARLNQAAPVSDRAPAAYAEAAPQPDTKRQIHGGAGVSVGTGGYRSGYVYSLIPVGETGTLGIAVSQTDFGKNRVPYGYGYGYAYPGYGYGPYGYARGGRSQSLAISYSQDQLSETHDPSTPEGCAPGFRDGDRYMEPLWVTRLHDDRSCATSADRP
ncbi:hypothetical protein [Asticcacaulis solisilvae]|uniref:hypothetical protein n=1 Tax=Asticcacaulis solisilvae TaxID=1217274 RepID=UPI003FD714D5